MYSIKLKISLQMTQCIKAPKAYLLTNILQGCVHLWRSLNSQTGWFNLLYVLYWIKNNGCKLNGAWTWWLAYNYLIVFFLFFFWRYHAYAFNFYLFQPSFGPVDCRFLCQVIIMNESSDLFATTAETIQCNNNLSETWTKFLLCDLETANESYIHPSHSISKKQLVYEMLAMPYCQFLYMIWYFLLHLWVHN